MSFIITGRTVPVKQRERRFRQMLSVGLEHLPKLPLPFLFHGSKRRGNRIGKKHFPDPIPSVVMSVVLFVDALISPEEQRHGSRTCMRSDHGTDGKNLRFSVEMRKFRFDKICHFPGIGKTGGVA